MSRPPTSAPPGEWYCDHCDAYRPLRKCHTEFPGVYCPRCYAPLAYDPAPGQSEEDARDDAGESLRRFWGGWEEGAT